MHYKSPFPAGNVPRRSEAVATDYVYADTPAINDGSTGAQFFYGLKTEVVDVYGCKTDAQFVDTLEDNIRKRGAMDKLISDRAKSEISTRAHDMLRYYIIGDWQSEPYDEHQNPAERKYQDVKSKTNQVLDIGALHWVISLGRFDVQAATVSLAKFRVAPRQGHLDRAKGGVYAYLAGSKDGAIRFCTGEPDYSELPVKEYDWMRTVYNQTRLCFIAT
jgi:hypothetical protein